MKRLRSIDSGRSLAAAVLMLLLCFLLTTPIGLGETAQSDDGISLIYSALDTSDQPKIAFMYSWNDRPQNPNFDFVVKSAESFLIIASFGKEYFINYLVQNGYTHILVPENSAKSGKIFHRWGNKGTIDIPLTPPDFTRVASTGGGNDVVLFKVNSRQASEVGHRAIPYRIDWLDSVRPTFYEPKVALVERGFHRYDYSISYENGLDVSWVFQYTGFRPEIPAFRIHSSEKGSRFKVAISLAASYGPNALPQVIRMDVSGMNVQVVKLLAGSGVVLTTEVEDNEVITIKSVLPCNQPRAFEPSDLDEHRFCFGITDLRVTSIQS